MTTGEIMKKRRKELGYSAEYVAERLGVSNTTIYRYEKGAIEKVASTILDPLSKILRITPAELMGWDNKNNSKYEKILTKIPFYNIPVSAGTGQWLADGHEYEYEDFEDVPNGADFALKVRGDSMEPLYSDGEIVFIQANVLVESGQVGVFCLNDEGYLKQLQGNRLVSLNKAYKPIVIAEHDSFFCAGRVIGKTQKGF